MNGEQFDKLLSAIENVKSSTVTINWNQDKSIPTNSAPVSARDIVYISFTTEGDFAGHGWDVFTLYGGNRISWTPFTDEAQAVDWCRAHNFTLRKK